jgi:hypothetical protein
MKSFARDHGEPLRFRIVDSMQRRRWYATTSGLLIAAIIGGACGSSDDDKSAPPSTVQSDTTSPAQESAPPPAQESPPPPFEQGQRIGLGERWELEVIGATIDVDGIDVAVALTNAGLDAAAVDDLASFFSVRPALLGTDTNAVRAEPAGGDVAAGDSFRATVTFPVADASQPPMILYFHGATLGALDATIKLAADEKAATAP